MSAAGETVGARAYRALEDASALTACVRPLKPAESRCPMSSPSPKARRLLTRSSPAGPAHREGNNVLIRRGLR